MVKLTERDWLKTKALYNLSGKDQHDVIDYVALHSSTKAVRLDVNRTRAQVKKAISKKAMAYIQKWHPSIIRKPKLSG